MRQAAASPISSSSIHQEPPRNPPTPITKASVTTNYHEQLLQDAEREVERRRRKALSEPAPLDDYLRKPEPVEFSSPPSAVLRQPLSPSQYNAPVPSSSCTEAEALLKQVQANKAYLESNLDIIARATTEEELYSLMEHLYQDESAREKTRIRKEVDNRIAGIQNEIQQELLVLKAAGTHHGPTRLPAERDAGPLVNKPKSKAGKKKTVQARINTGLKKGQKADVEDRTKTKSGQGKENVPTKQRQMTTKPKKLPPRPSSYTHNRDEEYIARVYGKATYQAQRRTLKTGPYLRYATEHTPKKSPTRPVPVVQTKGIEVKSSKTQTKESSLPISLPPGNQFFFDPYPSHQPSTSASVAPTHGQLIPMAIPLGEPRVGVGLSQPVTITTGGPEEGASMPMGSPRQKTTNVAVVNVVSERRPQLEMHHLPSVNIDTAPPTPAPSEDSIVQPPEEPPPPSPPQLLPQDSPKAEVAADTQFSNYLEVEDKVEESSSSEDELPEPGISLPGYRGSPRRDYHGPPFPPKAPPPNQGLSSDVLAAGIRRKDVLENQAVEWIEQELMARMISELNNRQQQKEPRPTSPDSSIMSAASSQTSMVEAYGAAGLQLFVDAGQPVNPELVDGLVREALEEKIAAMLGQRQREPRPISVETQKRESSPEPVFVQRSPIPTPEVTPKASPVHTPPTAGSPITTPAASIAESSLAESEPESVKTPEPPPREETPAPLPVPTSPVATPAATPPPTPPKAPTPELSPRESPVPLLLNETDLPTPSATPEPVSPEPEPEKIEETPPRTPTPPPAEPTPPPPPPPPPVESSETESEESPDVTTASVSETVGKDISEGEWLISKSEGQVDLIQDALAAKDMKLFEASSADSTMRGTEDIERDLQEPPSEGEILPSRFRKFNLTDDPVVALLTKLGHPLQSTPEFKPPVRRSSDNGARSPGEVSLGQRPSLTPSTERFVIGQIQAEGADDGFDEVRAIRRQLSPGELGEVDSQEKRSGDYAASNQPGVDSTLRVSHLVKTNDQPSNPTILVGSHVDSHNDTRHPAAESEESKPPDVTTTRPQPAPRPHIINVAAPRVIQVGGGRLPDVRDEDDDALEERGAVGGQRRSIDAAGMTPVEDLPTDQMEDGDAKRQPMPPGGVFGTHTMSDFGASRTMTPDAINIDALLQSGYLSQTFSQSEAGTSDFERTGERMQGYPAGGLSQSGELGMTSGTTPFGATTMTEDSLEFPKKMKPEKGPRTFSVTLPSAQSMQDVGDSSEGDIAQVDTISDVSEISAGDL
ncbi:protein TALPID3-like [Amphiura filiformis]|uniref:protein TALPID3-like n=1 Tax=Amphiura filiformis TaxID=82378 RepID=UPI003B20E475